MATGKREHKFAVLFSGSTDSQYMADMQKVFDTLTQYYNYDPANILVVFGTWDAGWAGWALSPFTIVSDVVAFQHSYFDFVNRSTGGHDPTDQALDDSGTIDWNTMVLYITGKVDNSGASPKILLRQADPGNAGDSDVELPVVFSGAPVADLVRIITGMYNFRPQAGDPPVCQYLTRTTVHLVLQTDRAYFFRDDLVNHINPFCMSFTFATDAASVNTEVATGSSFTGAWTDGMRMIPDGGGLYADQVDTLTGEATDNLLISSRKLAKFVQGGLTLFDEKYSPGLPNPFDLNLGKPAFWLKDGDEHTPPRAWYESPDIWITSEPDYPAATSEDNDFYVYGVINNVHIRYQVTGTHPVRLVQIGAKVFRSGGGGPGEPYVSDSMVPAAILKPGDSDEYIFDYDFPTGYTHRWIRAMCGLTAYVESDLDEGSDWDPPARSDEAQRNTDPSPLKKKSADTDTATGEANIDEQAPDEGAEPADGGGEEPTDTKTTDNLRGTKEHIFLIRNNFRWRRDFIYKLDPLLFKRSKEFYFSWSVVEKPGEGRIRPLKPVMEPYPHLRFTLNPGEEVNIVNHIGIRKEARMAEEIPLRFDIEMGIKPVKRFFSWRLTTLTGMRYRRFSGVTLKISEGAFSMEGFVVSAEGKPVPGIYVVARSLDTRQSAVVKCGKKGEWAFRSINPDSYRVYALHKGKPMGELKINGFPVKKRKKQEPFKIVLD